MSSYSFQPSGFLEEKATTTLYIAKKDYNDECNSRSWNCEWQTLNL